MNLIAKGGIAVGALGATGGITYGIVQHFTTIDIATKLSDENYDLLEADSSDWTEILKSYTETIKVKPELKFENFDGTKPEQNTEKELQKLCNVATRSNSAKDTNNSTYNKAKKWCTKPRSLTNLLAAEGYAMLDTKATTDTQINPWNDKLNAHKNDNVNTTKKFTDLQLDSEGVANQTNRDKLRKKCGILENKKHYEQEFEKELEQAKLWCATNS